MGVVWIVKDAWPLAAFYVQEAGFGAYYCRQLWVVEMDAWQKFDRHDFAEIGTQG